MGLYDVDCEITAFRTLRMETSPTGLVVASDRLPHRATAYPARPQHFAVEVDQMQSLDFAGLQVIVALRVEDKTRDMDEETLALGGVSLADDLQLEVPVPLGEV